MGFDPWNYSLKIRNSIETPIPKMGAHLGVRRFIPSHSPSFTLSFTLENMRCDYWASFLAHTLASICFGYKPKIRVVTNWTIKVSMLNSSPSKIILYKI